MICTLKCCNNEDPGLVTVTKGSWKIETTKARKQRPRQSAKVCYCYQSCNGKIKSRRSLDLKLNHGEALIQRHKTVNTIKTVECNTRSEIRMGPYTAYINDVRHT